MIVFEPHESFSWVLLDEGKAIADHGSHEVKVFESVPPGPEGIALSALQVCARLSLL
jgi:hypothetical protein